jgi:predicted nucleic acid-binding protein
VIVVDTNILAYRWLPSPNASKLEGLLAVDSTWAAPLLWRSEFRNLLAGLLRSNRLDLATAETTMDRAKRCLTGGEFAVADRAVLERVATSRCTAYDCEFVALADALRVRLVTEDKALLSAFPKTCRSLDGMFT